MSNVRKQAFKALKVVLRKRRLQAPKPSRPIFVQPLMHLQFTAYLRYYLKQAISKRKDHIPSSYPPQDRCSQNTELQKISSTIGGRLTAHGTQTTPAHWQTSFQNASTTDTLRSSCVRWRRGVRLCRTAKARGSFTASSRHCAGNRFGRQCPRGDSARRVLGSWGFSKGLHPRLQAFADAPQYGCQFTVIQS